MTLDRTKALALLRRWEPGECVDDDALISGLVSHFIDGGGVPPELDESDPLAPADLAGLPIDWFDPCSGRFAVWGVFEMTPFSGLADPGEGGFSIVLRGLAKADPRELLPRGWFAIDLRAPIPHEPF